MTQPGDDSDVEPDADEAERHGKTRPMWLRMLRVN